MRRRMMASIGCGAKKMPTARDYVQDGLVAMWDGIENAGLGVHDPNAKVWKDICGSNDMTLVYKGAFSADALNYADRSATYDYPHTAIETMEVVCSIIQSGQKVVCLNSGVPEYNRSRGLYYNIIESEGGGFYFDGSGKKSAIIPFADKNRHSFCAQWTAFDGQAKNLYHNGKPIVPTSYHSSVWISPDYSCIGGTSGSYPYIYGGVGQVCAMRIYNRILSKEEIAANYAIDKARFGIS